MLDKKRVRDVGLNAVRALHAGRYDIVIAELMKKMRTNAYDAISRSVGGIINHIPTIAPIGPQYLQSGGPVVGNAPSGNSYNLTLNYTPNNSHSSFSDARDLAKKGSKRIRSDA